MQEILDKITKYVEAYQSGRWQSLDNLKLILRELSSNYYYLTKINIEAFQKHNAIQYLHKGAIGRGLILAEEQCPELRLTRKILIATSKCIDAVRSEISIIKSEI